MHRWVRYEAPVMVCVAMDDDGGERVINIVIGEDLEDIRLVRDGDGQPLVYDEHMELMDPADTTATRAVDEAEERDWPEPDDWEGGPDPLRFPGLYDQVEDDEEDEDEDDEDEDDEEDDDGEDDDEDDDVDDGDDDDEDGDDDEDHEDEDLDPLDLDDATIHAF